MPYETVIWLEIHLKLNTKTKLFCGCANVQEFHSLKPNTHICPICTGQPGALPVLQPEPLEKALLLGLALQCHLNEISTFDRKSYFYPDLPMGYQITQQWKPTCIDGEVSFYADKEFTQLKTVRIRDAHIEIDSGKTIQEDDTVSLDYNRSGTPLIEIVTQPDFTSGEEVVAFLKELQGIARLHMLSDANMEQGQMRCDVNISLRPEWTNRLGTRVEMKNMNSFSAIQEAIQHEVLRQTDVLDMDGVVDQETRGRNDSAHMSYVMRSKEEAMDYRFMPEPDLPPVVLDLHRVDELRTQLQEFPVTTIMRYKQEYGFNKEYINGVLTDVAMQKYFESFVTSWYDPKLVAGWLVGPVARWCNEQQKIVEELTFGESGFKDFLDLQVTGKLSQQQAKAVMQEMLQTGDTPTAAMDRLGIVEVDSSQIDARVTEVFAEKPELLTDLQSGNMKSIWFVIGQVMQKSGGNADPKSVQESIRKQVENK